MKLKDDGSRSAVAVWAEMIKFSHSIFALPFALIATFLAGRHCPGGLPSVQQVVLIVVCMVSARSAAMTFNRIADYTIDARNPRTANRPLQTGRLSLLQAWVFLCLATGTFAAGCFSFYFLLPVPNKWPMYLGGPVLAYLFAYSFAKRFTRYSHFMLGSAIALSPIAAWIAIDPASLGWPAIFLSVAVTLWIGGFDIIYACQDIEVDRREGLHSLPSGLGAARALAVARFCHVLTVGLLVLVGRTAGLGLLYYIGVALVAALLLVENLSVRPDDFSRVNLAFFTLNGIVSVVMCAFAIADVIVSRTV